MDFVIIVRFLLQISGHDFCLFLANFDSERSFQY